MGSPFLDEILLKMHTQNLATKDQLLHLERGGYKMSHARLYAERVRLGFIPPEKAEGWLPEHDRELKALAADPELTNEKIADILNERFGTRRTKNAVIGRLQRLKVARAAPTRLMRRAATAPKPKRKPEPVYHAPQEDFETLFQGIGSPFSERACRWPLDKVEGEQTYCCNPLHKKSYCKHHFERAYRTG